MIQFLRRCWRPLLWCVIAILTGLLQFWCMVLFAWLDTKHVLSVGDIIKDCGVLFFCTALVTTLALDYFTTHKHSKRLGAIAAVYILVPGIVVAFGLILYAVCYLGSPKLDLILRLQALILGMSVIYAFAVKYYALKMKVRN